MTKNINKYDYPLYVLNSLQQFKNGIRQKVRKTDGLVEIVDEDDLTVVIQIFNPQSNFYFLTEEIKFGNNKVYYPVKYVPKNSLGIEVYTQQLLLPDLFKHFDQWVKILRDYDNVKLVPDDRWKKEYEDQFFAEFEIIDDNADSEPFTSDQQIWIDTGLERIEQFLITSGEPEEVTKPILERIQKLRKKLPTLSKKEVVRKISEIYAWMQRKAFPVMKKVKQELIKQLIKRAVDGTLDGLGGLLT